MLTALILCAQQNTRYFRTFLLGAAIFGAPACYQAPQDAGSAANYTSSSATTDSAAAATTASAGTTSSNANTTSTIQVGSTAIGAMTITPDSNPYVCLGAATVTAGAPLILTTCNLSSSQKWLYRSGRLQLAEGLCLSIAATGTAALMTAPVLAACNLADDTQVVAHGAFAGLVVNTYMTTLGIAAEVPTATNSNVTFENYDPNNVAQKWNFGLDNAATGSLQTGTFRIAPIDNSNACLSVASQTVSFAPCAVDQAQGFRWNDIAQLAQNENCLTCNGNSVPTMVACNALDTNQHWNNLWGPLTCQATGLCLNTNDLSMVNCTHTGTLDFDLGVLPKTL